MTENLPAAEPAATYNKTPMRVFMIGLLLAIALGAFFSIRGGLFAPAVGRTLNDQLSRQFKPLAGQYSGVSCPPGAKFHAGGTIICDVRNVAADSALPNLKYVEVVIGTNNLFHALPISG